ncbi:MAG: DUF3239 domain-containing protein, partial [Gemmataceae bacterium]
YRRRRRDDDDDDRDRDEDDDRSRRRRRRDEDDDDDEDDRGRDRSRSRGEAEKAGASNPCRVVTSLARYFSFYPMWPLIWSGLTIGFGGLAAISLWFLIGAFLFAVFLIFWIISARTHFWDGDCCPAVVFNEELCLVAVYTDMRKVKGIEHPSITVARVPRRSLPENAQNGDRLVTGCWYNSTGDDDTKDRWGSLEVIPLSVATNNSKILKRVMNSVPEEDWGLLEAGLKKLPDDDTERTYFLNEYDDTGRRKKKR